MTFQQITAAFRSHQEADIRKALIYLYDNQRNIVLNRLKKAACTDTDTAVDIFHDALLILKEKIRRGLFEGDNEKQMSAFLQRTSFFLWGKHPDNPRKDTIKRGKKNKPNNENEANQKAKVIHIDPTASEQSTSMVHRLPDDSSIEDKQREEQLSKAIAQLINQLDEGCQERIRLSKYYLPSDRGTDEKISHKEIAEDMGDHNEKSSRKQLSSCLKKLKNLIKKLLNEDEDLNQLLTDII